MTTAARSTSDLASPGGAAPIARQATRRLDARLFGVRPGIDCTRPLRAALDAACDPALGVTGLDLPPGILDIEDSLVNSVACLRGLVIEGAGVWGNDAGVMLGTVIRGHGMAGRPILDLNGVVGLEVRNLAVDGGPGAPEERAGFGIRLRSQVGTGGGMGLYQNVWAYRCDQGFNFGAGGAELCAADMTLIRCVAEGCRVGYQTEHLQAVNLDLYGCGAGSCDDAFFLRSQSLKASMFGTYDVKRLCYCDSVGVVSGVVQFDNVKLDGVAHRTRLWDSSERCTIARVELKNITQIPGTPETGEARIKVRGGHMVRVVGGGANLCGPGGPLFEIDGSAGGCGILVQGAQLPRLRRHVVGRIVGRGQYRVQDCFADDYLGNGFLGNYSGGAA